MTSLGTPESHGDKNIGKGIEPVTGKTNKPNIANTVTGHKFLHPRILTVTIDSYRLPKRRNI